MNKLYIALAGSLLAVFGAAAESTVSSNIPVGALSNPVVERSASTMLIKMTVEPSYFSKKHNREVWLKPLIVSSADSLWLQPVVIAGRTRYYQHLRADGYTQEYILLHAGSESPYEYSVNIPYKSWMEKGELQLVSQVDGCCGDAISTPVNNDLTAFDFRKKELDPMFVYVKPMGEIMKTRQVEGRAYIDFPVNKTTIYPDYRRNPDELAEIRKTIDAICNDKDVEISSLTIKGYASPEGPYTLNEKLAKGRTEALIRYVGELYAFPKSVLHSDWEAEDWNGLAERIEKSNIDDKVAILALVNDTSLTPDARDAKLKKDFPSQYDFMLANFYPALRHSDYNVTYVVRNYTDLTEIAEVMKSAPQKLSLEELFLYAQSLDKDSPEFREVMEVAVRMYPDDPVANLNAATTAVDHGEYDLARSYLKKAGDSPEAAYTAGVLEAKTGNYDKAKQLLEKASEAGIADADTLLANMRDWGWIN